MSSSSNRKTNFSKGKKKSNRGGGNGGNAAPPGFSSKAKSTDVSSRSSDDQRAFRRRSLFLFHTLVGKSVEIQTNNGCTLSGIVYTINPETHDVVLKFAQILKGAMSSSFENGCTCTIKHDQLVQIYLKSISSSYNFEIESEFDGAANCIRTDTEISSHKTNNSSNAFGRDLQSAQSWLDPSLDVDDIANGGLHDDNRGSGSWNQFDANKKLFGVSSTFDENLYTTKLDKSKLSAAQSREAAKLAKEIECQPSTNSHVREERTKNFIAKTSRKYKNDTDMDEEDRYSSVLVQSSSSNSKDSGHYSTNVPSLSMDRISSTYVPPCMRSNTNVTKDSDKRGMAKLIENEESKYNEKVPKENQTKSKDKYAETIAHPPLPSSTSDTDSKVRTINPNDSDSQSEVNSNPNTKTVAPAATGTIKKSTLNVKAKEFKLSAKASSFKPSSSSSPTASSGATVKYRGNANRSSMTTQQQNFPYSNDYYAQNQQYPAPPQYPEDFMYADGVGYYPQQSQYAQYPPYPQAPYHYINHQYQQPQPPPHPQYPHPPHPQPVPPPVSVYPPLPPQPQEEKKDKLP